MLSSRFPQVVPELNADTLILRALSEADIPGWYARATDREAADLAGDPVPESVAEGRLWLDKHRDRFARRLGIRWAVVRKADSVSLGTVGFSFATTDAESASLGVVIARSHWGQGIGSIAVAAATRYAFAELALKEVRAEVLQRNRASVRLLQKCGFELAQVLRPTPEEPEVLLLYKLRSYGGSTC